jgi:hypothetical protein
MLTPPDTGGRPIESLGSVAGCVLDGPRDLGLATAWVGHRIHFRKSVGSTSAVLKSLAG